MTKGPLYAKKKRQPGEAWRSCLQIKQFRKRSGGAVLNDAASKRTKKAEQDRLLARESSNKEDKGSPCVPKESRVARISVLKPRLKSTTVEYPAVMG